MDARSDIPIRFYRGFLENDFHHLPEPVKEELTSFLEKLIRNPDDPDLLAECQQDPKGRLAYQFSGSYTVYWRVIRKKPERFLGIYSLEPQRIDVLEVRQVSAGPTL